MKLYTIITPLLATLSLASPLATSSEDLRTNTTLVTRSSANKAITWPWDKTNVAACLAHYKGLIYCCDNDSFWAPENNLCVAYQLSALIIPTIGLCESQSLWADTMKQRTRFNHGPVCEYDTSDRKHVIRIKVDKNYSLEDREILEYMRGEGMVDSREVDMW